MMHAIAKGRNVIDTQATAHLHKEIVGQLSASHLLSGCDNDTVAQSWGIEKTKIVKVIKTGYQLSKLGNNTAALVDVLKESRAFMAACCGILGAESDVR